MIAKIRRRFYFYLFVGVIASLFPWWTVGVVLGFQAVFLNAVILTTFYAGEIGAFDEAGRRIEGYIEKRKRA